MENKPGYWAVIPAQVRYDPTIPPSAKLLYAEISSLTDVRGYCYASNAYFESLYNLSERTIVRLIRALEAARYIRIEDGEGGKGRRKLYAGINPLSNPDKNVRVTLTKMSPPPDKNVTHTKKDTKIEDQSPPNPPEGESACAANTECGTWNAELSPAGGTSSVLRGPSPAGKATEGTPSALRAPPSGREARTDGKARRRRGEARKEPDWEPEMFQRLWALYPRGEDKQAAMDEWDKLHADRELMNVMSAALKRQMASEEWRRGVGIPYLCRWLSKRRWEDAEKTETAAVPAASQGEEREEWT